MLLSPAGLHTRIHGSVDQAPGLQTWSPVAFTSSTLRTLISMRFTSLWLDDVPRAGAVPGRADRYPRGLRFSS